MPRIPVFMLTALGLTSFFSPCLGGEFHHHRARVRCRIPDYGYGFDDKRVTAFVVSEPAVEGPISMPLGQSSAITTVDTKSNTTITNGSSISRTIETQRVSRPYSVTVNRKQFVVGAVTAGPVRLERIGASADETGRFTLTGILSHSGGLNGELKGGRVEVFVRALSAASSDGTPPAQAAPNSPSLWETRAKLWSTAGNPTRIHLRYPHRTEVVSGFSQVTRIEIQLVYRRDR